MRLSFVVVSALVPLFGACAQSTPAASAAAPGAVARLVTPDGKPAGSVALSESNGVVTLQVDATGLTPGVHGFHIHSNGACTPTTDATTGKTVPFGGAGGHFDPQESHQHGHPGDTSRPLHAGELPNLTANAEGRAVATVTNNRVLLAAGKTSVMGRSLIIHADPDDYKTNPAGNSGPRVLCGVIQPA
ncbi:MAG: hypothetical protein RLZZ618_2084 [Pseudomonadota bacterium]|jgi:Cu-Zn family superoxide dismutase